MIKTNSTAVRAAVERGELSAEDAVDLLINAGDHGGASDCTVRCPECGADFWRTVLGNWNTCSDQCQVLLNTAIFDLDGGRTIVRVSEMTAERTADLLSADGLAAVGLGVPGPGRVVPS